MPPVRRRALRGTTAAALAVTLLAAPAARGTPLLWRVEKSGRTSHLFGTAHLGLDLDATLEDVGRAALADAERIFVEQDLTAPETGAELARVALARGELPPGDSLRVLLGPATWGRLMAVQKDHLLPETLDRMQPWYASLATFPLVMESSRTAAQTRRGAPVLDAAIVARAEAYGVKVMTLETPLQGVQVFSGAGTQEGVAMLEELLANPKAARQEIDGLVGAYRSADERSLEKGFGRLLRRKPALAERLLFRRNELWCDRLDLWLRDSRLFVAVGAFHMFGDRGLVALLRERGYRVERVRPAAAPPPAPAD